MMDDEVAALVVDNGSGKYPRTYMFALNPKSAR